jgi:hypothetical protein
VRAGSGKCRHYIRRRAAHPSQQRQVGGAGTRKRRFDCILLSMGNDAPFASRLHRIQQILYATRANTIAVCAKAGATIESVQRARAARQRLPYAPVGEPTFVPENRSRFSH